MKMMKTLVASLFGLALSLNVNAQNEESNSFVHGRSDSYEWPTDKAVLEKLDKWQDQKFGVLFHWGSTGSHRKSRNEFSLQRKRFAHCAEICNGFFKYHSCQNHHTVIK